MLLILPQLLVVVLICAVALYQYRTRSRARRHGLPPGPKALPFVGNIMNLPPQDGSPEFQHWLKHKDNHGPISTVTALGTTMVLLHSRDALEELLSKKSTKTSGRPQFYFGSEMCGFGGFTPLLNYNATHRFHRKLIHQQMGTKKLVEKYYGIQDLESKRFLLRVLDDPANLIQHIKTEATALILRITYGYSIEPHKPDPLVGLIERMMDNFSQAINPMVWAVDMFPQMRHLPEWLPGMSFQKTGRKWLRETRTAIEAPYAFVKRQTQTGPPLRQSYVSSMLELYGTKGDAGWTLSRDHEEAIKNTAAIVYGGGADTTVSTMSSLVLAMVLNPEVQRRAQREIDDVLGADEGGLRLPEFRDRPRLPYVNAVVKEALRWLPVVPIGTAHVADEELEHAGYRIPKGAYLLPAIWWFLHDPETHPDPETFEPERFLPPREEPDPAEHAFGYGRRICPGRHLADDNLYLTIARLLAAFDVGRALDARGRPLDAGIGMTPGLISHPRPFPYSIRPRSAAHAALVRAAEVEYPWEESDAVLLEKGHF